MADTIAVEVVYALPQTQELVSLEVSLGTTLRQAVELSGLLQRHPEIDAATASFGIYARLAKPDTVLRDRDRVEIYRPLIADPKEVRRRRAAEGKAAHKGKREGTSEATREATREGAGGAKPRSA